MNKRICIVAIVKDEEPFLDEWLFYHRLIGVDHFFLYDDDLAFPLRTLFKHHADYLTIIDWHGKDKELSGRNNQTKAYWHAIENYIRYYEWVAFIDADEFIVLPAWDDQIHKFLDEFEDASAISLNWHVFGHNGYYETPQGLITSSLTRRMQTPNVNVKTITRTQNIVGIDTAHFCKLNAGLWFDANHKSYNDDLYEGKTERGYINHYQCRSFKHWMSRVERGDVNYSGNNITSEQMWRCDKELLLKKFVESIAYNKNEYVDEYMLKFGFAIQKQILLINRKKGFINAFGFSDDRLIKSLSLTIDRIAEIIMGKIDDIESNCSIEGKGKIINYILNYARFSKKEQCEQVGLRMLEHLLEEININTPVDYRNGITGLGALVECLVQNCLFEADTDELLEDIDALAQYYLITKPTSRIEAFTDGAGLGKYFLLRMQNSFRAPSHPIKKSIKRILTDMVDLPSNLHENFSQLLSILNVICNVYKHLDEIHKSKLEDYVKHVKMQLNFFTNNKKGQSDFLINNPLNIAIILYKAAGVFNENDYNDLANAVLFNYEIDYLKQNNHDPLLLWLNYYELNLITQATVYQNNALDWLRKGISDISEDINKNCSIGLNKIEELAFRGLFLIYAMDERTATSLHLYD